MTTGEAIERLKQLDPSGKMDLCAIGHFGEAVNISPEDFYLGEAHPNPEGWWRRAVKNPKVKVVGLRPPDIGEEPT